MNAVTTSSNDNAGGSGSDSDTSTGDLPEYYQPISAEEVELSDQPNSNSDDDHENDRRLDFHHHLPNGYAHCVENGVSSLDLSDEEDEEDSEKEFEEEEERTRADVAIRRAFREDESRRNAPLTPENAVRVMEAMRGVSFGGLAPDWAGRIPEDQWINQLRGMRQPPPPATSTVQD